MLGIVNLPMEDEGITVFVSNYLKQILLPVEVEVVDGRHWWISSVGMIGASSLMQPSMEICRDY